MTKRRPILMGKAERIATATEDVCPTVLTRDAIERASVHPIGDRDRGISITSKCHREAGVKVWYFASSGRVLLACAKCSAPAAWIQVANEVPT